MAGGLSASGRRSGNVAASGERRCLSRKDLARRALGALLLGLCAGCSSKYSAAVATSLPSSDPAPVMTESLLLKPVDRGRLSSAYGIRRNPVSKRRQMHRGIDWAAPRGTAVRAAGDGIIISVGRRGTYGRYVLIDHGGTIATAYAHLDGYAAGMSPGHHVRQGDVIGQVGSTGRATGPHLHYEVLVGDHQIDPLALAPPLVAQASERSDAATDVDGELGIGGPDIDAGPAAGDGADQPPQGAHALSADAIDGATVIWVEDLLKHHGP